jgi:hypothetical protein
MPLPLTAGAPTVLIRKESFERVGLTRSEIDKALTLTDQEFRVEGALIAIGPIYDDEGLESLIEAFEGLGLELFDDYFEMSGNWPEWMTLFSMAR